MTAELAALAIETYLYACDKASRAVKWVAGDA